MSDDLSGHEALRFRLQQLQGMTPNEIIEATGREKWTVQSLTAAESVIRGIRESLGSNASGRQFAMMARMVQNIGIAQQALGQGKAFDMTASAYIRSLIVGGRLVPLGFPRLNDRPAERPFTPVPKPTRRK